jgi:hypothetical protein
VAALGKKIVVLPTVRDGFPDELFAAFVTLACINYIESGVERALQEPRNRFFRRSLETNLGAAETKDRHPHIGFAELPLFHASIVGSFRKTPTNRT